MLNDFCQLNPYRADKAILRFTSKEQVSLVGNKKGWQKVGNYVVKIKHDPMKST